MDEIEQRLKESSEACIKSYESWRGNQKSSEARETLMDAVHELRKVASRLEIEIAVSERDQMADRPLPIPPHRSSRRPRSADEAGEEMGDDEGNNFNREANNNAGGGGGGRGRQQRGGRRQGGNRPQQGGNS